MKATESTVLWCLLFVITSQGETRKKIGIFFLGFSEPKEISHANDDCGDDDDKRYLNFKVYSKVCCLIFMAYLLNTNSCVLFVLFFRKDIFTRKKIEQEKQKDQKRGKSIELKQTEQR